MNLRQIEVFRAVMLTGSTLDAARLLHISQPGVSRMIRHIESQLGVPLFERARGRLAATPEARTLHDEIDRVYRGVQHIDYLATHLRHGSQGSLRVVSSSNTGLQLIPRAIARLNERFPQSTVVFEVLPTREITRLLVAEEVDIAISSAPLDHPVIAAREIGRWTLLCALPARHRLARRRPLDLPAVLRERLITYSPEAPQSRVIDALLTEWKIARNVAAEVRSGHAACSLVAAGVGVAFVDDLSARTFAARELSLQPMPAPTTFPIFSAVNLHRPLSQPARVFVALVEAELTALSRSPLGKAP